MNSDERCAWLQQQIADRDRFIEVDQAEIKRRQLRIEHLAAEIERLHEELDATRAHEHVLVIVGDMLARHLEWMVEEPTSGLDAEVLDAIKGRAAQDVQQWRTAIQNAGFTRLDPARVASA